MKMPSKDEMRAEFHRLRAELEAGQATVKPLQDAYEKKHAEISAVEAKELKPLAEKLKAERDRLGLHELQAQMGIINRALNGETGAPPKTS